MLTTSGLTLPPGFSLVGTFPTSIAAGASASFTVRLETARAGVRFGAIRFQTNDADESTFTFNVEGSVSGAYPIGAPILALPGPAVAASAGGGQTVLDGEATLADSDSPNYDGGQLVVEFAAGGSDADRLAIRNQGTGAGQIGVNGTSVTFAGVTIGTFSGGVGLAPLVVTLNANATATATQELIRSITYANVSPTPTTPPRYVRLTLTDGEGKVSNQPIKVVIQDYISGITTAESAGSTAVAEGGATDTYTLTLNTRPAGDVTVTVVPNTQVDATPRSVTFTPTNWRIPRTIVVSGVDDPVAEGTHTGAITHTAASTDPVYSGITLPSPVPVHHRQ